MVKAEIWCTSLESALSQEVKLVESLWLDQD